MPINVACNDCDKQLTIDDQFAGKRIKCPKCQAVILVPADGEPTPRHRHSDRDEIAERPRARTAPGRREDDLAETPRRSPASDASPDNAFVDLEAPSPSSPYRKKKGSGLWLWLGLGGGGAVLLLGTCVCGGVLLYVFDLLPFGRSLGSEAKYLPDDTQSIMTVRVDQVQKTRYHQAQKEQAQRVGVGEVGLGHFGKAAGVKEEDVERMTLSGSGLEMVIVFTTKKVLTPDEIKTGIRTGGQKDAEFAEEQVSGYTLHVEKGPARRAFCLPERKILVMGSAATLRSILRRGKKPDFPPAFQKVYSEADFSSSMVILSASENEMRPGVGMGMGLGMGRGKGKPAEAVLMQLNYGPEVTLKMVAHYKDAAAAEEARKEFEEDVKKDDAMGMGGEAEKERKRNAKISKSGTTVTMTTTVKEQTMIDDLTRKRK